MKKLLVHIIFAYAFISSAYSQCAFDNTFYVDLTPASAGATASDGCVWGGDLITVNVVMGETYIISTCASVTGFDSQITLYNASGTVVLGYDDDFCGLLSEITYVAGYTGVLNVLVDEYNCADNALCAQLDVTWVGGCAADVGTFTILENGLPTTNPIYLCWGATSCIDIISNDDYVLPPPVVGEVSEVMYAIFSCPPSGVAPDLDPCFTGFFWTGEDFNDCNSAASILLGAGLGPTVYYVPVTMDDSDNNGNPNGALNYDNNGDGCYDMGSTYEIVYLSPITFATVENCDGTVSVTISGGMPEENASNYVITNTGNGTLAPGTVTHGGVATITGLTNGQAYSLSVTDTQGCTTVYPGGTFSSALNASFNYSAAAYCVNAADPTPTITGTTGGTFTSSGGLVINATTGQIDVSASTPGAYTVTYTTPGPCSSSNVSVTINALDNASFNYSAAAYCVNASDPTPTISGLAGGTFSSTAGLSINPGTGAVDVSVSTPGTYTVTYTTAGSCPNSSNVSVTINALDNASFNYSAAAYCVNASDPTPTISGLAGGTFSSTAGLSINPGTGTIDVSASTPGTYTVTYTTAGTCPNSSNVSVTINALDNASFNYSAAAYCVNASDPTPTISGLAGGTFSSSPAGLTINPGTGAVDVSVSTPGTYTVTYTTAGTCPNSSNVSVTINALDNATFNYGAASYCLSSADPSPTITGVAGGTFSSTAGLAINPGTGTIDVSASTPGTYNVTYTTAGSCPNSSNVSVTINALDNATFNYSAASYCVSDVDPTPTISGLAGGTFSSSPGLVINSATGVIDVSASMLGTYVVTYTTAGTCPNSSNVSVTINFLDNATFNYSAAAYCVSGVDPTPTISGLAGGTFSSTAGLSINPGTGAIDVSASIPGTYTVTYTTAGSCPNSSNVSVTITALDNATFNYGAASYCLSSADPTPTITGLSGGTFSSTAGLVINSGTGTIDVSASTPGTYTVTYSTAGTCTNSSNVSVTITALDDATFNYSAAAYCVNDTDPTPTISGVAGGTFSSTVGLSINATTGTIDVSASTAGVYTVTYSTGGACANSSNVSVTINALDDATFNYSAAAYCMSDVDPTPTITGLAGGTFSSTAGLSINVTTGLIDVSASSAGLYTVTYTTAGTCPNSSNVSVTITALDDASFNYSAAAFCMNGTDPTPTITGAAGGTFSSTAGLVINAATGQIDLAASTAGTYSVTYTTSGACSNSSNVSVVINSIPTATAINSGPICADAPSFTLDETGGNATGWTWSTTGGATITNTGDQSPTITGAVDGEVFTVTVTDINGCSNAAQTTITINALPTVTATNSGSICEGDAITLNETGGEATSWSWATNGAATITNTGDQSPTVSGGVDGEMFTITGTDVNGCVNTSTTTIVVVPMPVLNAIADVTVCDSYTLPTIGGSNLSGNEAYYDDSQSNGGSVISGAITSTQVVWVYDATGSCSDELSFTVTINNSDDASFSFADFCSGDPNAATIIGTTGGTFDFDVNPNDGASINPATGEIASGVIGTTYTVSYTTTGACPASSIETVSVIACEILVPTAITPSAFPNNTWELPNLDLIYPNNTVTIYNRWGNVVFEHTSSGSNPYSANPWDGTLKGTELPVASYYYVIKFNDGSGDGVNGIVTIIRN